MRRGAAEALAALVLGGRGAAALRRCVAGERCQGVSLHANSGCHSRGGDGSVNFFAFAASVMRSILVDHARRHASAKRGGGAPRVELGEAAVVSPENGSSLLELHQALERLAAIDARKGRIVELRHFGGLSVEETAEVMGLAPITIKREWLRAKAWLHRELNSEKSRA